MRALLWIVVATTGCGFRLPFTPGDASGDSHLIDGTSDALVDARPDAHPDAAIDAQLIDARLIDAHLVDAAVDAHVVDAAVDARPIDAGSCEGVTLPCPNGSVTFHTCNNGCWAACTLGVPVLSQHFATVACNAWGGKLAPIRDAGDQSCVAQVIFPQQASWIGFEQSSNVDSVSAGWSWNSDGAPALFLGWASGQPDDGDGTEDQAEQCASMSTDGSWQDTACDSNALSRFSCRRD